MMKNWLQRFSILLPLILLLDYGLAVQSLNNVFKRKNAQDTVIVTTAPLKRSGITKRAILIGSRVCGKGGLVESNPVKIDKREDAIDLDSLHKDLKQLAKGTTNVIAEKPPGQTHVVSKVSTNKPQWFDRLNRCCIDHEECNRFIPAKQERYNYKNNREYTIYDCKCDDSFAECLKYADSYTADAVGDLYFNVLKMPCINFADDPISNTGSESQSILDKVNEVLAKKPRKNPLKGDKNMAAAIEGLQTIDDSGRQRSLTVVSVNEKAGAKEREARHFNRNGHV